MTSSSRATAKADAAKPRKRASLPTQSASNGSGSAVHLRLYVAGRTPKSMAALENLRRICEEHMPGRYDITVIDLLKNPQLARGDQIVAIPTVVKNLPTPLRKLIGDLSNTQRVLVGLDLKRTEE